MTSYALKSLSFILFQFTLGIDFVGPISPSSTSGNRYVLTLSDYFNKVGKAVPLPSKEAHGVANALLKVTYRSTCIISND